MKKPITTWIMIICAVIFTAGLTSCESEYSKESNELIQKYEIALSEQNLQESKRLSNVLENRELNSTQTAKVRSLDENLSEWESQINRQREEDKWIQDRMRREQENREREAERNRQIANEAYEEVIQLQNEVLVLINKLDPCRRKMSYSVYGSFDYQNARIEYSRLIGSAIEKQKRAIKIAKNKIGDESLIEDLNAQLYLLEQEKQLENETDARRGREFGRRGY